jgi:hypothetical protein
MAELNLPQVISDVIAIMTSAKGAPQIPKERAKTAQTFLKTLNQQEKSQVRLLLEQGKTDLARERITAKADEIGLRTGADIEKGRAATTEQIRRKEAGSRIKLREERQKRVQNIRLKRVEEAAVAEPKRRLLEAHTGHIESGLRTSGVRSFEDLRAFANQIPTEIPEGVTAKQDMLRKISLAESKVTDATQDTIRKLGITNQSAQQLILDEAGKRGHAVTGKALKDQQLIGRALAIDSTQKILSEAASAQGADVQTSLLEGATKGSSTLTGKAVPKGFRLRESVPGNIPKILEEAAAQGAVPTKAAAGQAVSGSLKGPLRSGVKFGGGIAALLAIPAILKAIKGDQQQTDPLQQLQLMQMLSAQQQQQDLAGSLIGSRNAQAEAAAARAQLLRLQASQLGGQPSVLI